MPTAIEKKIFLKEKMLTKQYNIQNRAHTMKAFPLHFSKEKIYFPLNKNMGCVRVAWGTGWVTVIIFFSFI